MNKKSSTQKYLAANVIIPEEGQLGALILGDCNSAIDHKVLKPHRVHLIISIGIEAQPPKNKIPQQIQHRVYDIHDNKQQKLPVELLDQTCELIENGRKKGGVLVHCYAGVSRSSSFVIAYLIKKYILSYDDAKERVKKRRACIHPGDGFIHQLKTYSRIIQKREEERLSMLNKKLQILQIKQESPVKQEKNQSLVLTQKTKRGVRGAVRSAQTYVPEQLKYSQNENKVQGHHPKVQMKLPPINIGKITGEEHYRSSGSKQELKNNIDKIEGRAVIQKGHSVQKIYSTKTKVI